MTETKGSDIKISSMIIGTTVAKRRSSLLQQLKNSALSGSRGLGTSIADFISSQRKKSSSSITSTK